MTRDTIQEAQRRVGAEAIVAWSCLRAVVRPSRSICVCTVSFLLFVSGLFSFGTPSIAQDVAPSQAVAINKVTNGAVQLGALTCAARVQQVTTFLGVTEATSVSMRPPIGAPDQNSLSVAMALEVDGAPALATADFFPSPFGCKAAYSITLNLPQPCEEVRTARYPEMGEGIRLSETITELSGASALSIKLITSGNSCTVIKSQTID